MVIDTSALIAIFEAEPDHLAFLTAIQNAESRRLSVATLVETSMVMTGRRGHLGMHELDSFISEAGIELVPVDLEQGRVARMAFSRFGKRRHRARLNYGDCFSYALAIVLGEPLLYKGDDFAHCDVIRARIS